MAISEVASNARVAETDLDDISRFVAGFDADERRELADATAALDIARLLYRAREPRGLSQAAAARAGRHQQAVSRFEHPSANPRLDTVQSYLGALGYALEVKAIDLQTGQPSAAVRLPPPVRRRPPRTASSRPRRVSAARRAGDAVAD